VVGDEREPTKKRQRLDGKRNVKCGLMLLERHCKMHTMLKMRLGRRSNVMQKFDKHGFTLTR